MVSVHQVTSTERSPADSDQAAPNGNAATRDAAAAQGNAAAPSDAASDGEALEAGHELSVRNAVSSGDRLLVTLCTYNERENLTDLLPAILAAAPQAEILVIDDNSPDGTGDFVQQFAATHPCVHLLKRAGKLGLGTATLAGFRYGIEHGYTLLLNLDADFSHHPRHIPELLACMARADVAIGSRYIVGGGVVGWGLKRHFMSWSLNAYSRLLLGLKTRDNTGSFRCYRVGSLRCLDLDQFLARGYAFQEEVLFYCRQLGCRFEETPIRFEDRRFGTTKINYREAVAALWVIARLACSRLTFRRPRALRPQSIR